MNYLTADECMYDQLFGIVEPVEIRDANGTLLGHYTPFVSPEEAADYKKARSLFDLSEMKRAKETEAGKGKTTAEVLERLQAMEK